MNNIEKWDRRFLDLARNVASWSKDPSTQTGAVIVRPDNTISSLGYNGFPKNIDDSPERYNNRELKYSMIIHCEMNAVLNSRERVDGYTLYTWPFLSCDRCAVHMIQSGISRVVAPNCPEDKKDRWQTILEKSNDMFREAGVLVTTYDF